MPKRRDLRQLGELLITTTVQSGKVRCSWSQATMSTALGAVVCSWLALIGCERQEPPGARPAATVHEPLAETTSSAPTSPIASTAPSAVPSTPSIASAAPEQPTEHPGPWLTVLQPSTAIYADMSAERTSKLGYAQSGARLPVKGKPKPNDKCNSGWLEVVPYGFVCSATGTLDEKDAKIKFTLKAPALDQTLPYLYARNVKNGTPLYRSIPTRAQMLEYEPYLRKQESPNEGGVAGAGPVSKDGALVNTPTTASSSNTVPPLASAVASPPSVPANPDPSNRPSAPPDDDRPWWQQDGIEDRLHEIRLSDLQKESDGVLALRMVKGFYIAVDRTFHWNGRTWYKSTKGLVAPADRMGQAAPSEFKGVALGADWHLPIGWVYGGRDKSQTYDIDSDKGRVKPSGNVDRFVALQLTDRVVEIGGTKYRELGSGKWVKQGHLRITEPGEPPKELKEGERWLDVNLSTQTLVLFEGTTPVYATLISSGKTSKIKDKDHATPMGQWRIREKHVTNTMDGDGTAAGDLPYSIEDVPYVMYFHKSYAVHGAFWHRNYGVQMSHGCINLAPLDAKEVFFRTEPALPTGWHGAWPSQNRPGSWVSIHE